MKRTAVGVIVLAASVLVGCGSAKPASGRAAAVTVHVFMFRPGAIHVRAGTTVTWTNRDEILHTVTSGTPPTPGVPGVSESVTGSPDGTFDGKLSGKGATYRFTFGKPGTFTYFCRIHNGMKGEISVT